MEMEQAPGENYLGWSQLHWAFMQHLHQWHDRIFDGQEYMAKVSCPLEDRFFSLGLICTSETVWSGTGSCPSSTRPK
jgi:hypothetical protein